MSRSLRHGRSEVADGLHHVDASPGRARGCELLDDISDRQVRRRDLCLAAEGGDGAGEARGCPAGVGCFPSPAGGELGQGEVGLVGSAVLGGAPGEGGALPAGGVPALPVPELGQCHGDGVVDLDGALREHGEQLGGDPGQFRLAIRDRSPSDTEAVRELGAQHRLVEAAEGALLALEVASVEREPAAVGGPHLGGDHDVGVQLGVVLARGDLPEGSHHQAARFGVLAGAVHANPGGRPVALEVLEHASDRGVVGVEESGVAGERPPHRDRLRGGERGVEPGDGRDQLPLAVEAVDERGAEPCPRHGVVAGQQRLQVFVRHLPGEAEAAGLAAQPYAGAFGAVGGQVVGVVAGREPGAAGVERGHPQHRGTSRPSRGHLSVVLIGSGVGCDREHSGARQEGELAVGGDRCRSATAWGCRPGCSVEEAVEVQAVSAAAEAAAVGPLLLGGYEAS